MSLVKEKKQKFQFIFIHLSNIYLSLLLFIIIHSYHLNLFLIIFNLLNYLNKGISIMLSKLKVVHNLFTPFASFSTKKIEVFINGKPYQVDNNLSIYQAAK